MSKIKDKGILLNNVKSSVWSSLRDRGYVPEDDMVYAITKLNGMRDERLKDIFQRLAGWGTEERSEIETAFLILLEVAKRARPSVLADAAKMVELRSLFSDMENGGKHASQ